MQWYRSLYARLAFGFVAFLAAMLVVQAVLLVWVMTQSDHAIPGGSAERYGQTIALDLSNELERDPRADIAAYLREQYADSSAGSYPFTVILGDGTAITVGSSFPSDAALSGVRVALRRARADARWPVGSAGAGHERAEWSIAPESDLPDQTRRPDKNGNGSLLPRPAQPVIVKGEMVAAVLAPLRPPYGYLLIRFAPMLSFVAAGVMVMGTAFTSILVFGPPRRRLRTLEAAARRFGSGDLSARAPDRGGDEISAVATAFNVMAADLSARAEALAASNRARRQLLADVSHELNTPVTAMRGYLETLAMPDMSLDEATRHRYLQIVGDETARLERIIGDLLDLARLEGGGAAWTTEPVQVSQIFDRVAARHERACADAGVTLQTSIEPGAETVLGDRDRLEQALQNLAANALRYAPRGTSIRVTARPAGNGAILSVADEGPGIPAAHLPHIFDRFYKADGSRTSGGSGLGLSIVKAIVERHGGSVSINSEPGRTVFELTIYNSECATPRPNPDS